MQDKGMRVRVGLGERGLVWVRVGYLFLLLEI